MWRKVRGGLGRAKRKSGNMERRRRRRGGRGGEEEEERRRRRREGGGGEKEEERRRRRREGGGGGADELADGEGMEVHITEGGLQLRACQGPCAHGRKVRDLHAIRALLHQESQAALPQVLRVRLLHQERVPGPGGHGRMRLRCVAQCIEQGELG
eukprot:763851-Hanusia_phi.AAC.2